jgi:hypothetical protein
MWRWPVSESHTRGRCIDWRRNMRGSKYIVGSFMNSRAINWTSTLMSVQV